ncbi:hypothetical protein [Pigmentiphaga soli]
MNAAAALRLHGARLQWAAPAVLMAVVAAALWILGSMPSRGDPAGLSIVALTLAGIGGGCGALAWVRPQRAGFSPPHVMLSLGFGGMLAGLAVDVARAGPVLLDAMCGHAATLGMADALALHLAYLPGMHLGMLAGGMLAIPTLRLLRPHCGRYLCSLLAQNAMCSAWMLAGMTAGAVWLSRWQPLTGADTLPRMLGGMFVGMTWGMVASVALYRGYFTWRRR